MDSDRYDLAFINMIITYMIIVIDIVITIINTIII